MFFAKPPKIIKASYKQLTWELPNERNEIYLTFDDGPTPGITDWTLDLLKQYNIKATFFCLGENVIKHPKIVQRIKDEGHGLGNHSHTHPSGWKTNNQTYFEDVENCNKLLKSKLFRPPYGRITRSQAKVLKEAYQIIMWNVLSGDYDERISPEKCLRNVVDHAESGSIVVFHDSEKAEHNLRFALPKAIEVLLDRGFRFGMIK